MYKLKTLKLTNTYTRQDETAYILIPQEFQFQNQISNLKFLLLAQQLASINDMPRI